MWVMASVLWHIQTPRRAQWRALEGRTMRFPCKQNQRATGQLGPNARGALDGRRVRMRKPKVASVT
jgi:hypothetical protein